MQIIEISPDQNTIDTDMGKVRFEAKEYGVWCHDCAFKRVCIAMRNPAPCSELKRKDGKNGYFTCQQVEN